MQDAQTSIKPNPEFIQEHITTLFARCEQDYPGGKIQLDRSLPEDKSWGHAFFTADAGGIQKATQWAVDWNTAGWNIYIGVNPRVPDVFPGTPAKDTDIELAFFQFADLDSAEAIEKARQDMPILNTFSVTTGTVPNKRVHLYWELEDAAQNLKAWQDTQTGLANFFYGDKVIDPRRILRLAGCINYPTPKKIERGYMPELVTIKTQFDDDREPVSALYMHQSFAGQRSASTSEPVPVTDGLGLPGAGSDLDVTALMERIAAGDEWHNNIIKLVAHWAARGWSNAEIIMACRPLTLPGYTQQDTDKEVLKAIEGARTKWNIPEPENRIPESGNPGNSSGFTGNTVLDGIQASVVTMDNLDPLNTPQRKFIYGRHLIAQYVAVTVSPGGVGKTTLVLTDGVAIATGRKLTHDEPHQQGNVWHYNLEDPKDELVRRVLAIQQYFSIPKENIAGKLFLDSGRDRKLIIAEQDKGIIIATPHVEQLCEEIIKNDIKVLSIDPFVKSHYAEENDNKQIDEVLSLYGKIAHDTGCAIDLVHHVRKPPQGSGGAAGDINQARGASAISGAVRSARTVTVMSDKEAAAFNIKDSRRHWYIRVDDAKANMSPPAQNAAWLERQSHLIGNATIGDGDNVGVLEPYTPPSLFDGVSLQDIKDVLMKIDKGDEDGRRYLKAKQSPHSVGKAIAENMPGKNDEQGQDIATIWFESGLLFTEKYKSPNPKRGIENGVFVDWEKCPTEGEE